MGKAEGIDKISVVARGGGVGHLAMLEEDKAVFTRDDMEAQITIAMAGIAAEELVLGQPSTGSESDLERATNTREGHGRSLRHEPPRPGAGAARARGDLPGP